MAGKAAVQEPMAGVIINGVLHQVPASEVDLQREIDRGRKLQAEIQAMEETREGRGRELVALISAYEEEIAKAKTQLDQERGPIEAQISAKQAELEGVKQRLFELMKPRRGNQKSMKFSGLAGSILAQRTLKFKLPDHQIQVARKLLGPVFGEMFETRETAKPLTRIWDVLKTLKPAKVEKLREIAEIDDQGGSVRFVD
ncbi:MAG: hypothetical protein ACOY94_19670 [Bacillota bacterium]